MYIMLGSAFYCFILLHWVGSPCRASVFISIGSSVFVAVFSNLQNSLQNRMKNNPARIVAHDPA